MIGVKPEGADGAAVHVIGGAVDTQWLRAFAQAHEQAGFDRVLVGYTSTSAEGFAVTGDAAAHTERVSYLIAHRPGFVTPTVAAQHCDVYALWGEPLAAVKQRIADIHEKAAAFGRRPRISVSLRPIIAPTESQAWERARRILAKVMEARPSVVGEGAGMRPQAVGARRLVDFAREAEEHDKRLWTPIAAAMRGGRNTTALVGNPDQGAESLLVCY